MRALSAAQYERALGILKDNLPQLHALAKYLYDHETITGDEFMEILNKSEQQALPAMQDSVQ